MASATFLNNYLSLSEVFDFFSKNNTSVDLGITNTCYSDIESDKESGVI